MGAGEDTGAQLTRTESGSLIAAAQAHMAEAGACGYNRPCAQTYVGKYQSCMVRSG